MSTYPRLKLSGPRFEHKICNTHKVSWTSLSYRAVFFMSCRIRHKFWSLFRRSRSVSSFAARSSAYDCFKSSSTFHRAIASACACSVCSFKISRFGVYLCGVTSTQHLPSTNKQEAVDSSSLRVSYPPFFPRYISTSRQPFSVEDSVTYLSFASPSISLIVIHPLSDRSFGSLASSP